MAILSCIEQDLEGARAYSRSLAEGIVAARAFVIQTDDPADNEDYIFFAGQSASPDPLPAPMDFYPGSSVCKYHQFVPSRRWKDRTNWYVVCSYKSIFGQLEIDRSNHEDPTARPVMISGVSRTIMVPVRFMLRTAAYKTYPTSPSFTMLTAANSASDPLDPPVEMPSTEWELHCTKHVSSLPGWFLDPAYQNGVNNADQIVVIQGTGYVLPAGYAKLSNLQFSELKQENDIDFITISWNTTIRNPRQPFSGESTVPSPWDVERLDAGMRTREKIGAGGGASTKWKNVLDATQSQAITTPVPFDGSGQPLLDDGSGIPEASLYKFCYRPNGPQVDYSVMPWS